MKGCLARGMLGGRTCHQRVVIPINRFPDPCDICRELGGTRVGGVYSSQNIPNLLIRAYFDISGEGGGWLRHQGDYRLLSLPRRANFPFEQESHPQNIWVAMGEQSGKPGQLPSVKEEYKLPGILLGVFFFKIFRESNGEV